MDRTADSIIVKAPAALLLALLLMGAASTTLAQPACSNDGIAVQFDEKAGSVRLNPIRVREITPDSGRNVRRVGLGSAGIQPVRASGGKFLVDGLAGNAFPDHGIDSQRIDRRERKAWKAEFERGDFEFDDEADLILDIQVSVNGGQAAHISGGASSIALSALESNVDVKWYGGRRIYLKEIEGDLLFSLTDLMNLGLFGTHRAEVSICINIRGNV